MNQLRAALLCLGIGVARAVPALPPGYEDDMWCPPGSCAFYTNPYGFYGRRSSFNFCYDPDTDKTTHAVFTGDKTDVVAPDGWIEPDDCTADEYSECDTDEDCWMYIDPSCVCYVSSTLHPFDPCESLWYEDKDCDSDMVCTGKECEDNTASCRVGTDGTGGVCELDYSVSGGVRVD